jgi:hypothetical protein
VKGIAAALLPYEADGKVAVEAFQQHLLVTERAGLMNAVNMDTGYVNHLSAAEMAEVRWWTREALGKNVPFVAGAYVENQYLGNVAFRDPVPAYKHSAAVFLHMQGRIPTDLAHAKSGQRPPREAEVLKDCAGRLGLGTT